MVRISALQLVNTRGLEVILITYLSLLRVHMSLRLYCDGACSCTTTDCEIRTKISSIDRISIGSLSCRVSL